MKFKSQIVTQASGSIGGTTFAHNRGGMYMRARSIPTDPNSTEQQATRATFSSLSQRWSQILSQANRDAWDNYAALTPVTDVFGDELILSGQQMFIRCNTVRVQGGAAVVDAGPTTPGNADLTLVTLSSATNQVSVAYDNTDEWANEVNGGLMIQTSRQLSAAINFHRSPFRFHSVVDGNVTPPTSPEVLTADAYAITLAAALKLYVRVRSFRADGRISGSQNSSILIA